MWKPEFGNAHNCMSWQDTFLLVPGENRIPSAFGCSSTHVPASPQLPASLGQPSQAQLWGLASSGSGTECQNRLICQELWYQGCIRDSVDSPSAPEGQGPPARGWQLGLVTQGSGEGAGPLSGTCLEASEPGGPWVLLTSPKGPALRVKGPP